MLAGGKNLYIDVLFLEQAVHVWNLGDDADGTDHGERCGNDTVGNRRHEITAARRDLVDRHDEIQVFLPNTQELGCGQAIAVNKPARALDARDDFIAVPGFGQNCVDLMPELRDPTRLQIALESNCEDAARPLCLLRALAPFLLLSLGGGLGGLLELGGRQDGLLDALPEVVQAVVETVDFQVSHGRRPLFRGQGRGG